MIYDYSNYKKEYYLKNKEKIKKRIKKYYLKNKGKIKNKTKEYRLKNLDKEKKRHKSFLNKNLNYLKKYYQKNKNKAKKYSLKNREKINRYSKKYHLKHKDERNKISKEWHLKNPEYKKEWYLKNPEKKLESNIKQLIKIGKKLKLPYQKYVWALRLWNKVVKKQQGNQCVVCGSTYKLNIHHILHRIKYPELSLNPNNGVPLCFIHHQEVHGIFRKS